MATSSIAASGVFARDTSGDLRQFYVTNGTWTAFDISKATGVAVTGDSAAGPGGLFART